MSISIMQQLFKLDLPKCEKAVVLAIASHLNEKKPKDGAWPSNHRLQVMTGWGERSIQYAVSGLLKRSILEQTRHKKLAGNWMPVYVCHPECGVIHPYFSEAESDSPPQSAQPFANEDANCASPPASGAEGTASQNGGPRTPCTQTTRNKVLNNKENYTEPDTFFEEKGEKHGEMTDERFRLFQQRIRDIAIEKFGTCDPFEHPVWAELRTKYFPPHWSDDGG